MRSAQEDEKHSASHLPPYISPTVRRVKISAILVIQYGAWTFDDSVAIEAQDETFDPCSEQNLPAKPISLLSARHSLVILLLFSFLCVRD
jgi:hypothetical protein